MKIFEIGTGYTSIPAQMGAATEIVVEELTKAFCEDGQDVTLFDIADPHRAAHRLPITEVKVPSVFTSTDVKLGILHKFKRVVYSIALARSLIRQIRRAKEPVTLHFHNQYNLFFFLHMIGRKLRSRVKIAYTVHSYIWPAEWSSIESTVRKRYFQEIYCAQHADAVLVLNDKTRDNFVQHLHVDPAKIHKIINGVNTDVYAPLPDDQVQRFKAEIGLENRQIIFQVGSVCPRKNQLGAVKMLSAFLQQNPNVVYAYAGGIIDPQYQQEIIRFAQEQNIASQVVYAGELCPGQALNRWYNAAALTVFPSEIESFGLVIIESISAGTPVLLADKPLFHLDSGYLLYQNPESFAQAAQLALQGVADDGRSEVIRKYSWKVAAGQHLSLFE